MDGKVGTRGSWNQIISENCILIAQRAIFGSFYGLIVILTLSADSWGKQLTVDFFPGNRGSHVGCMCIAHMLSMMLVAMISLELLLCIYYTMHILCTWCACILLFFHDSLDSLVLLRHLRSRETKGRRSLVWFWSGAIRESPSATSNLSITRESNDDSTHQATHHRNFQATSQRHEVYNNHRRRSHAFGRRVCLLGRGGKDRRRDCGATRHSEWKDGEYLFCTGFNFGYSNAGLFSILNADIQPGVRVEWSRVYVFDLPDWLDSCCDADVSFCLLF